MSADVSTNPITVEEMDEFVQEVSDWARQLSPRQRILLQRLMARAAQPEGGSGVAYDIVETPGQDNYVLELALVILAALESAIEDLL